MNGRLRVTLLGVGYLSKHTQLGWAAIGSMATTLTTVPAKRSLA
jgi:hypothetical protein